MRKNRPTSWKKNSDDTLCNFMHVENEETRATDMTSLKLILNSTFKKRDIYFLLTILLYRVFQNFVCNRYLVYFRQRFVVSEYHGSHKNHSIRNIRCPAKIATDTHIYTK